MVFNVQVPFGFQLTRVIFPLSRLSREKKLMLHRLFILLLTFLSYACYHASRKPISVVKNKLIECPDHENATLCKSWITEMNNVTRETAERLEGLLDSTYLFSYAFFMFFSGVIAERVNLRYFLSLGMIFSGIFTVLFGMAFYTNVHTISYFIVIQLIGGAFQTTGWPSVVTIVANWFGKAKKGLIFGIWNSHTNVGNILGSTLAGMYVADKWGMSFIVPGALIIACGIFVWLFLIVKPGDVDIELSPEVADQDQEDYEDIQQERSLLSHTSRASNHSQVSGELTPLLQSEESDDDSFSRPDSRLRFRPSPSDLRGSTNQLLDHSSQGEERAISFWAALKIPGVIEFSFCLFFAKLVSYVFLFWLPYMISESGKNVDPTFAAYFSTLFDVGGILGGILAGLATDLTGKSATTCAVMLIGAIPMLFGYQSYKNTCYLNSDIKDSCYNGHVAFLLLTGLLVNGPYALITTAVSAELGTHPSLRGSSKALATVTSVIDGTGSIGAAIGPFLAGAIGVDETFYMLIIADVFALLLLVRLVNRDIVKILENRRQRMRSDMYARQS